MAEERTQKTKKLSQIVKKGALNNKKQLVSKWLKKVTIQFLYRSVIMITKTQLKSKFAVKLSTMI